MPFLSPLRYPGGKRKLANYMRLVYHHNDLCDGDYVEAYAGGASISLALLFGEYARHVHINDIDRSVYSFWHSVLNDTDALCRLICDTPITIEEWYRQRQVQTSATPSLLELGFSTFYLNRTNRSGIIGAGVIGGRHQSGLWRLDARYNKPELISRITRIARYTSRIRLHNMDAIAFLRHITPNLPQNSLIYLDPPYYVKGKRQLYASYYGPSDHVAVSQQVRSLRQHWIVTYDDVPEVHRLYWPFRRSEYGLHYSAQHRYKGAEVMFFSNSLRIPEVADPSKVNRRVFAAYLT